MFEVAEAYEVMMGRWSRQLAPLFVEFVGVRDGEKVLDVGCGTGSLSATLARVTRASKIVGIEYARTQIADPRVTFEVGDAETIDPTAKRPAGRRGSYGSAEALSELWNGAGLTDIEIAGLTISCLTGEGPTGAYMTGLSADLREALRKALRQNVLGDGPDGPFTLQAKAWAVRGVVA